MLSVSLSIGCIDCVLAKISAQDSCLLVEVCRCDPTPCVLWHLCCCNTLNAEAIWNETVLETIKASYIHNRNAKNSSKYLLREYLASNCKLEMKSGGDVPGQSMSVIINKETTMTGKFYISCAELSTGKTVLCAALGIAVMPLQRIMSLFKVFDFFYLPVYPKLNFILFRCGFQKGV